MKSNTIYLIITIAVIAFASGLSVGYLMYKPDKVVVQPTKPQKEIRQKDSSLVLKQEPNVNVTPAQIIPKGYTVTKVVKVVVRDTIHRADTIHLKDTSIVIPPCPDVEVDMSLIKNDRNQTTRVIASSPNGIVLGGIDVPIIEPTVKKQLKWSAGITGGYNLIDTIPEVGAYIDRDVGPFRLGVHATGWKHDVTAGASIGIRF